MKNGGAKCGMHLVLKSPRWHVEAKLRNLSLHVVELNGVSVEVCSQRNTKLNSTL